MDRHTQFLTSPKGDGNFLFTCVEFLTHWGREEKWQTDTEGGEEGGMHSFSQKITILYSDPLCGAGERNQHLKVQTDRVPF